jgi:hypothetical protein
MGKDEDFQLESFNFISKVPLVKHYNQRSWFNGAYSTLNSRFTIKDRDLSKEEKAKLSSLLFSSIDHLRYVSDYDQWFFKLAKEITDNFQQLSFGHAQKLINILMKYHFVFFNAGSDVNWNKEFIWLMPFFRFFHAPIDRKVLLNLQMNYNFDIPLIKLNWTRWTWADKSLYEDIQDAIQRIAEENENYYNNRLYFEMKELWKENSE